MGSQIYRLNALEYHENELIEELKRIKYNDLENMVYRMEITYDEIVLYHLELMKLVIMTNPLMPSDVIVNVTFDDIRMRTNLTSKTIKFTKSFFCTILSFAGRFATPQNGFIQKQPETY